MKAVAYLNHGRWVADCPFCEGGGEREWPQGLRRHQRVPYPFGLAGGKLYCGFLGASCPVVYPKSKKDIERVVALRAEVNQNWMPGETVADLERENQIYLERSLEHGVV